MGNNRYELLFMDDDIGGGDPLDNVVAKSKKQVKTTSSAPNSSNSNAGTTNASKSAKSNASESTRTSGQNKKGAEKDKASATLKNETSNNKGKPSGGDRQLGSKQGGGSSTATNTSGPNNNTNNNNNNRNVKRTPAAGGASGEAGGQQQSQQQQRSNNTNLRQQNGNNETREQRNNRRNARENGFSTPGNESNNQQQQQPRQFRDRDQRGPPRNRNFEGGNRKREFDRQSGSDKTGVKAVDKRDGAGAHNWGSVKEAIDEVNKNDLDSSATVGEKSEDSGNEQTNEPPPTAEEEAKELTLDEYKAQMQQRSKPTFNLRKAGEGEDTTQWKKMHVLHTNKKKETESEEELEFDPAMYPQRVGRQQRVLDIQFNFNDGRRGGGWGGRGGRGGAGGGGPGGPRGPRPGNNAPNTGANEGNADRPPRSVRVNAGGGGGGGGGSGIGVGGGGGGSSGGGGGVGVGAGSGPGGAGAGGKRNYGDRQPFNAAPKVNDERQFPTLA